MPDDPIVAEIRKAREAFAASMDYDLKRMVEDIQSRQGKDEHPIACRKPVPVETPPVQIETVNK